MSTHRHINKICCAVLIAVLILTVIFCNAKALGVETAASDMGYEERLFDASSVHTINIVMDDWDGFLETCTDEEYTICSVVIDNEAYKNVGIRAKGNTSLSSVAAYGNDRYSFKIEFDHYDDSKNYYGLDKISLNNIIQDNTYMKDYLSYQMMGYFGVDSPLCSYVNITVNGEDWGLYLAVEGVEESFLERNYGSDYGELYKPDSTSMGGGRGNGGGFDMDDAGDLFGQDNDADSDSNKVKDSSEEDLENTGGDKESGDNSRGRDFSGTGMPGGKMRPGAGQSEDGTAPDMSEMPDGEMPDMSEMPDMDDMPGGGDMPANGGGGGMSMGSDDVSLIYSDDDQDSYSNIFDNAKTDATDADKDRLIESIRKLNEGGDIESVVDAEEVIRYFVVHNFVCNFDSYTGSMIHNYYLYEEDGVMSMIPWDYNLAFGGFMSGSDAGSLVNYPIDTPVSGGTVESRPMLAWIFSNEEYTEMYHEYFAEFISEYFDSGYFEQMIDSVSEMIAPYVESDPTKFCTYDEFEEGVSTLKEFCLLRAESVNGQLDGTIPSTSDGQSEDNSTLIDAGDMTISAMGSMGNTMGMGGGNTGEGDGNREEEQESSNSGSGIPRADMENGEDSKFPGNMEMPGGDMTVTQTQTESPAVVLLGASVIVLIAGLVFAIKMKR